MTPLPPASSVHLLAGFASPPDLAHMQTSSSLAHARRALASCASATLAVAAFALLALSPAPLAAQGSAAQTPASIVPLKVVDTSYVDRSANACTDFFQFANGAWLAHDTIPAAYSSTGVGRDMSDKNELVVRSVLDDVMQRRASLPQGSTERKLGTFYASCMDSTAAERAGVKPLAPMLAGIDSVRTQTQLMHMVAELHRNGVGVMFRYGPDVDAHDAEHYMAAFSQGGLGLPDRDYYTRPGASADSLRDAYVAHIARTLVLAGAPEASARTQARQVMALETELAKASLTRVERRDPAATDHPMPIDSLQKLSPAIAWRTYLRAMGSPAGVSRINVGMPAFFTRVSELVRTTPMTAWRAYLRYHLLADASPFLSTPFVQESFTFQSRFTGAKQLLPRWKRCLRVTDGLIGEALGEAYVRRTFPPEARARAKAVIDDIRAAFGERVKRLDWMSDTTRAQALHKLAALHEKVGYPEHWRDYSKLQVAEGPFALNVMRASAFEWDRVAGRPGQPVDTTEWGMTPPTVNAYYDPSKNEIVFPAGALQPQTFDANADDAANYGSLGASWAGHELTHGFDDEGRHFDADGNLRDWWTPADSAHFTEQAQRMVEQFDGYIQVDTLHVNGKLTLGENIADYGGLLTAYDALQRALERNGRPGLIDGFTPEQRFFLAYAQSWRSHQREEQLRSRVTVDPHAPERWRVNGPLSNMEAFARAWGCKPGDPMVRAPEVVPRIW
ncbi:MAG TPA: M13 family metallopeptidase [Gemmatimonadaceae bacterium]|nr:M13 family metallopeptidase [Gemmatimonadaceae bacterium]